MTSEAYQMYAQGFKHKEIAEYMSWSSPDNARWKIKQFALAHGLPYPILPDHSLIYNLYLNGMSLRDIGRYVGIKEGGARKNLHTYCRKNGIPPPIDPSLKAKVAYDLRQKGLSYGKIAKMVGYYDRKNCHTAIKRYMEKECLPKPPQQTPS